MLNEDLSRTEIQLRCWGVVSMIKAAANQINNEKTLLSCTTAKYCHTILLAIVNISSSGPPHQTVS